MVAIDEKQGKYELVLNASRALERSLRDDFHAEGRGLGSLVSSVAGELPKQLMDDVYSIASIRNSVIHDGKRLSQRQRHQFANKVQKALARLGEHISTSRFHRQRAICAEWLETCPFVLDRTAKRHMTIALRKLLDERPVATNSNDFGNRLNLNSHLLRSDQSSF